MKETQRVETLARLKKDLNTSWELFTRYGLPAEDKARLFSMMVTAQRYIDYLENLDTPNDG